MKKLKGRDNRNQKYLLHLGKRIQAAIVLAGYTSVYDFWIHCCEENGIARSTLNYIVAGQTDPKITTLKAIAESLGISITQLLG
jgi:transcriptional regulator with XRE-family HTH domain